MDESKVEELSLIHRDLARFLGEQYKTIESMSIIIAALQKTIEGDPNLAAKCKANLRSLKEAASARTSLQSNARQVASQFLNQLANW